MSGLQGQTGGVRGRRQGARTSVLLGTLGIFTLLLGAGTASAAMRYAAPGAVGAEPCNPAPCSLTTAVGGAEDGDQVVLANGTYESGADLVLAKAIEVGGEPGASPAIVFSGAHGAVVENAGATLHDLRLSLAAPTMAYVLQLNGGTIERSYVDGRNGVACRVTEGAMRNSVCFGLLAAAPSGLGNYVVSLRNVTAAPLLIGAQEEANLSATVVNTIAQPGYELGSSKSGLVISVGIGSAASVILTNSNYASVDTTPSTGSNYSFNPPGTNGNQTAASQFVNGPAGDFHQLATSPTIDAGIASPEIGPTDIDREPRSQGSAPDIGADEFPALPPTPSDATAPVGSKLSFTPRRFRPKRKRAPSIATTSAKKRKRSRQTARVSYRLSENAGVRFTVRRFVFGFEKTFGKTKRCLVGKRARRLRKGKKCKKLVRVKGAFAHAGRQGANRFRFSGYVGGRRLRPGAYRMLGVPTDAAGNRGRRFGASFVIAPR
ncbi:MAG TPA: choice-of-anchor Q domain-containing protein [Solirubrobacterales bacterium]